MWTTEWLFLRWTKWLFVAAVSWGSDVEILKIGFFTRFYIIGSVKFFLCIMSVCSTWIIEIAASIAPGKLGWKQSWISNPGTWYRMRLSQGYLDGCTKALPLDTSWAIFLSFGNIQEFHSSLHSVFKHFLLDFIRLWVHNNAFILCLHFFAVVFFL